MSHTGLVEGGPRLTHLHVAELCANAPPTIGPRTVPAPHATATPAIYSGRSWFEVVTEI